MDRNDVSGFPPKEAGIQTEGMIEHTMFSKDCGVLLKSVLKQVTRNRVL